MHESKFLCSVDYYHTIATSDIILKRPQLSSYRKACPHLQKAAVSLKTRKLYPSGAASRPSSHKAAGSSSYFYQCTTDNNENTIFLIYKEIQKGAVATSYMTKNLRISSYIRKLFLMCMTLQLRPPEFPYK
jgi:hypothetical protein